MGCLRSSEKPVVGVIQAEFVGDNLLGEAVDILPDFQWTVDLGGSELLWFFLGLYSLSSLTPHVLEVGFRSIYSGRSYGYSEGPGMV